HAHDEAPQAPHAWAQLLTEHDADLALVRMLWRRGRFSYRPIIPPGTTPDQLKQLNDWESLEQLELPQTHFPWKFDKKAAAGARLRHIQEQIAKLWRIAGEWTRAHGPRCDFLLVGYDRNGEVLFESGKQYATARTTAVEDSPDVGVVEQDRGWPPGTIEIIVGRVAFRVRDKQALRVVIDALA